MFWCLIFGRTGSPAVISTMIEAGILKAGRNRGWDFFMISRQSEIEAETETETRAFLPFRGGRSKADAPRTWLPTTAVAPAHMQWLTS